MANNYDYTVIRFLNYLKKYRFSAIYDIVTSLLIGINYRQLPHQFIVIINIIINSSINSSCCSRKVTFKWNNTVGFEPICFLR